MIYPVLQEKFARDKKNIAPVYPALLLRLSLSSGPDGIRESMGSNQGRKAERTAVPPHDGF